MEHVAEVEARTNTPGFNEDNRMYIKEDPELEEYYQKCRYELLSMRNYVLEEASNFTYFDVLMEPLVEVHFYAMKKDFRRIYRAAFPIYASRLQEKFNEAILRQEKVQMIELFITAMRRVMFTLDFDDPVIRSFYEIVYQFLSKEMINEIMRQEIDLLDV